MKFKKLISAISAAALAAAMTLNASADVIWEPYESDFYQKHQEDAEHFYNARQFVSDVDVNIYDEPNKNIIGVVEAGTPQYVDLALTDDDGVRWGSFGYMTDETYYDAWICLDGMSLVYDSTEFLKDHEGEFTSYNGEMADVSLEGKDIYFWKYPGSYDCTAANYYPEDIENYFDRVYTDEYGSWGYIGYMMGERDVWLYLDDPTNPAPEKLADVLAQTEIVTLSPEKPAPVSEEAVTDDNSENPPTEDKNSAYLPAVILAVSAAAIAAVCLAVFGRKKKSDGE